MQAPEPEFSFNMKLTFQEKRTILINRLRDLEHKVDSTRKSYSKNVAFTEEDFDKIIELLEFISEELEIE